MSSSLMTTLSSMSSSLSSVSRTFLTSALKKAVVENNSLSSPPSPLHRLSAAVDRRQLFHGLSDGPRAAPLFFRQLFDRESWTYTYVLADEETREAVVIDPVLEQVSRDASLLRQNDLQLTLAVNTHVHADHVTGTGELKKLIPGLRSAISSASGGDADVKLHPGDAIPFGRFRLEARATPGHTDGCMTFLLRSHRIAFTGDALLVRGCGRTDFQQGNAANLFDSVWREILSLSDDTLLFPAHDYVGFSVTTVAEEKKHNPRLSKSKQEFIQIMENLNLPYPKKIDASLPANLVCGLQERLKVVS